MYFDGVAESVEQREDVQLPPRGKVLCGVVVAQTAGEPCLVLIGEGCVAAIEMTPHSVPECAGSAVEEGEWHFSVAHRAIVRSRPLVEKLLVCHGIDPTMLPGQARLFSG